MSLRSLALGLIVLLGLLRPLAARADETKTLQVGGLTRSYIVHTPPDLNPREALALVVVLHGGGGSAASTNKQTHFSAQADRSDFIVAYPDGSDRARPLRSLLGKAGFNTWNAGTCCGYAKQQNIDDVAFIRAMVAQMQKDYPINPHRIYATGISNGGMMAYRLACEASDVFAAIAPVSAVQTVRTCQPSQPVAVMHIHGTADQNVPMAGGVGSKSLDKDAKPPVLTSIQAWLRNDGCPTQPQQSRVASDVTVDDYRGCRGNSEVAFYQVQGGGHAWPGGDQMLSLLDRPTLTIDATALIWDFFVDHPKP